jgi:DNA repair exonuclease SbcCD ATPase subunit
MATNATEPTLEGNLSIDIENIGGIEQRTVDLPPGVTVLEGGNATGRTSFLQALMAAIGSERATLKGDADEGHVTLNVNGQTYTRTLSRAGENLHFSGDPLLDDPELADLYAFLLSDNEVRQTIEQQGDLHEVLMRPVDTEEIQAEIDTLHQEQKQVEADIERAKDAVDELTALEEERVDLTDRKDELEAEIEDLEEEVQTLKEQTKDDETKQEINDLDTEINDLDSEIEQVEFQIRTKEEKLEGAKRDLENLDIPDQDEEELEAKREEIESEKAEIDTRISSLTTLEQKLSNAIEINKDILNADWDIATILQQMPEGTALPDGPLSPDGLEGEASASELTDQLVKGEHTICQSCGSEVNTEKIRQITNQYEGLREDLREEISQLETRSRDLKSESDDLRSQAIEIEDKQAEQEKLTRDVSKLETELEELRERKADLEDDLKELNDKWESIDTDDDNEELIDTRSTKRDKERELERVRNDISDIEAEIDRKEEIAESRDDLEARKADIKEELNELRGKVDALEKELVDQFNDRMEEVIDLLDYENIERIWIDTKKVDNRQGEETEFDLIITREGDAGGYQDRIQHLSESERAVTGLVVALTGYLVHDVHEICPVMLFDSVEMIDSERIRDIINYFQPYPDYLVAALLPEDAADISEANATLVDW